MTGRLGFKEKKETFSDYIGKIVCAVSQSSIWVYGVLKEINNHEGYADFLPSVTYNLDGTAEVNNALATRVQLPIVGIRPLNGGLEEQVESFNKKNEKNKKKI